MIMPPAQPNTSDDKERDGPIAIGYMFHAGSMQSTAPAGQVLFSVPTNHFGKHWYLEIPFEFDLPAGKELRKEEVGGMPEMVIDYSVWDLPPKIQREIVNK